MVLVFYYSDECSSCMSQLFVIEQDRAKYEEKGALVMAIAVQSETDAALTAQVSQAQFPILADDNHTVTQAYGVLDDRGLSSPSVFIINKDQENMISSIQQTELFDMLPIEIPDDAYDKIFARYNLFTKHQEEKV